MDPVWLEFRLAPAQFLSSHNTDVETLVHELVQVLSADVKSVAIQLSVLSTFQEYASFLIDHHSRLELVLTTLRNMFEQHRQSGTDPLLVTQILVTTTDLLIEREDMMEHVYSHFTNFVSLLLVIIEKIKTEPNRLLRAIACDCLRELEICWPGLLTGKVGHFYAMSQAENSFIHQHYMALFAVVFANSIDKIALQDSPDSPLLSDDYTTSLSDLLSFADKLTPFKPSTDFREVAKHLTIKQCSGCWTGKLSSNKDLSEVKKGVAFLVDHTHLFTPSGTVQVVLQLVTCLQRSGLAPTMLKGLMLRYSSSFDFQLFHLVLLLKILFGEEICDERDEDGLINRLVVMCCNPAISLHQRAVALQWLAQLEPSGKALPEALLYDQFDYSPLLPSVFDSTEAVWLKLKLLVMKYSQQVANGDESGLSMLRTMLTAIQKPVLYGVTGSSARLLCHFLVELYQTYKNSMQGDIQRVMVDTVASQPHFTPYIINLLASIESKDETSTLSVSTYYQLCQWLSSQEVSLVHSHILHFLALLEAAARHDVNPELPMKVLQGLVRSSSLCSEGVWSVGNALLGVCFSLMRAHCTNGISRDLSDLLLTISTDYQDIDIRDRARFYLQMLLNVSGDKLTLLLSESSGTYDLTQTIEARISSDVHPVQPPITQLNTSVINMHRLPVDMQSGLQKDSLFHFNDSSDEDVDLYLQWLKDREELFTVTVPCKLSLSRGNHEGVSDKVFAVVLQLTTTGPYQTSPNVYIPCLSAGEEVSEQLSVIPIKPLPATFNIRAVFTDENGHTYSSNLNTMGMTFQDFFHPPPVGKEVSLSHLYQALWEQISLNQQNSRQPDGAAQGALSVMKLPAGRTTVQQFIQRTMKPLIIDQSQDEVKVLIFLPPLFHVLLKFTVEEQNTTVWIATNNWSLLPLVDTFLSSIKTI